MRILNRCPHCQTRATARSSRDMSLTLREVRFHCENEDCLHIYIVNMEFARTLSPSHVPNPELNLPISPHARRVLFEQLKLDV
jgi:hypothetical protein